VTAYLAAVARATGLDDATAYRELAALLLHGITR
jgi:hypothetical protein